MEPSFKEAKWGWGSTLSEEEEVYRNTLVQSTTLIDTPSFDQVKFTFKAKVADG